METIRLQTLDDRKKAKTESIRVSSYDKVSGMLLALILFVGFFVGMLFLVWLTTVLTFKNEMAFELIAEEYGDGEEPVGYEDDLEPPGLEEVTEITDPQIEQTLEAVTTTVSSVAASFDPVMSGASSSSHGTGRGTRGGRGGTGIGDSIPRWERWEIHYASENIDEYARQLDFFKIEIGAAGGGGANVVEYGSSFSGGKQKRSGAPTDEKRLYMTWTSGNMRIMDRQLLGRCGVTTAGRVVMQFYPKETEDMLAAVEQQKMREAGVEHPKYIQKTIFAVDKKGNGYEYRVLEQRYRNLPSKT